MLQKTLNPYFPINFSLTATQSQHGLSAWLSPPYSICSAGLNFSFIKTQMWTHEFSHALSTISNALCSHIHLVTFYLLFGAYVNFFPFVFERQQLFIAFELPLGAKHDTSYMGDKYQLIIWFALLDLKHCENRGCFIPAGNILPYPNFGRPDVLLYFWWMDEFKQIILWKLKGEILMTIRL